MMQPASARTCICIQEIKFNAHPAWADDDAPGEVPLAAANDVTRQRCVQAIRASIADVSVLYNPNDIAFTVTHKFHTT